MRLTKWRSIVVLTGLALLAGVIPAAQAGRSARVGASSSVAANAEGDGVINYRVVLSSDGYERECERRRGRRVCRTYATFTARIPAQEEEGETPDQSECRFGRTVKLFEVTRRGNERVASDTTNSSGEANFGRVDGVRQGDEFFARAESSTFSDRYGDLITCAADNSNHVTL